MRSRTPVPAPMIVAVALLLGTVLAGPLGAQDPDAGSGEPPVGETLTLAEAARRALEHHPSAARLRARRRAAEGEAEGTRAALFPRFSVSGSATRYQEPMVVTPIHGFTPGQTPPFDRTLLQGGGHVTYTLWDGGARSGRIEASRSRADAARADLDAGEQSLLAAVAGTYLEILSLDGVLGAHDERIGALRAELERVEELLEVGRAAPVQRLRVQAALDGAEAARVEVDARLRTAETNLARLVGLDRAQATADRLRAPEPSAGELPPGDTIRARALHINPSVLRARREVRAADAAVSVARAGRWPRLELGAHLLHWGSDDELAGATEWNAGLQVSVPVFTGGAVGSDIERAEARRDAAREGLRLARLQSEEEVDAALAEHRRATARIRSLESQVRSAREVARIEALRLDTGTSTQPDFLDAQAALLEARADLSRARHAALGARVRLARAQGILTPEWLARTLGGDR